MKQRQHPHHSVFAITLTHVDGSIVVVFVVIVVICEQIRIDRPYGQPGELIPELVQLTIAGVATVPIIVSEMMVIFIVVSPLLFHSFVRRGVRVRGRHG